MTSHEFSLKFIRDRGGVLQARRGVGLYIPRLLGHSTVLGRDGPVTLPQSVFCGG